MITRRGLIGGILAIGCAPAIVRVGSIMPVKAYDTSAYGVGGYSAGLNGAGLYPRTWTVSSFGAGIVYNNTDQPVTVTMRGGRIEVVPPHANITIWPLDNTL